MKYYNYPDPRGTEVAEDVDSKNISDFAPGGGGGNVLHVVFGWDEYDNPFCDHSFNEVFNALENKDLVIFSTLIKNGAGMGIYAASCDYGDDYIAVCFNTISMSVDSTKCFINIDKYTISPDNTIDFIYQGSEVSGTPIE